MYTSMLIDLPSRSTQVEGESSEVLNRYELEVVPWELAVFVRGNRIEDEENQNPAEDHWNREPYSHHDGVYSVVDSLTFREPSMRTHTLLEG